MDQKGLLNMIANELYRVSQEGAPQSGVGQDSLNHLNEIAQQLSKALPAASMAPVSQAIQGLPVTMRSIDLPMFMINGGKMLKMSQNNSVSG